MKLGAPKSGFSVNPMHQPALSMMGTCRYTSGVLWYPICLSSCSVHSGTCRGSQLAIHHSLYLLSFTQTNPLSAFSHSRETQTSCSFAHSCRSSNCKHEPEFSCPFLGDWSSSVRMQHAICRNVQTSHRRFHDPQQKTHGYHFPCVSVFFALLRTCSSHQKLPFGQTCRITSARLRTCSLSLLAYLHKDNESTWVT